MKRKRFRISFCAFVFSIRLHQRIPAMSNHSHAGSGEMTAEDENRRNSETDDIHGILGNFMQAKEETLEELVGGFMFLTLDDVRQAAHKAARGLAPNSNVDPICRETEKGVEPVPMTDVPTTTGLCAAKILGRRKAEDEGHTDDIEEEVLEGSTSSKHSCEDALFRHRPASLTKFDNFVLSEGDPESEGEGEGRKVAGEKKGDEDGEEDEEDWLPTSGYMASFGSGTAACDDVPQSHGTTLYSSKGEAMHQTTENAGSGPSPLHISAQPSTCVTLHAKDTSPRDTHCSQLTENCVTVTDSTGLCCESQSSVCDDEVEAPAWALNPGEAEEEITSAPVTQRVSVIGTSAAVVASAGMAHSEEKGVLGDADDESSNEVVPFELDEHYDYDNVAYTPKFTQAEMNYLTSFLPHNS